MISYLTGKILKKRNAQLILDVQGVGYGVSVTSQVPSEIGQTVCLEIYYHFNQEQGPQLYGFLTDTEKQIFTLIMSCSGIGPKIALSFLETFSPAQIIQAISLADVKTLSSVSGVGTKKAEMIILHLKEKILQISLDEAMGVPAAQALFVRDVSAALQSLQYSRSEIQAAVEHARKQQSSAVTFEDFFRTALLFLSKKQTTQQYN